MGFQLKSVWTWGLKVLAETQEFFSCSQTLFSGGEVRFILPSLLPLFQGNESIVAKTTVTVPNDGGPIEAVSTIETVPYWTRSRRKTGPLGL